MPTYNLLIGDALERLRALTTGSVNTCVTSPPYWGLRDYGTARWEGGNPDCDHFKLAGGISAQNLGKSPSASAANVERSSVPYKDNCGKCGATRVDDQIGLEETPWKYVARMVEVFEEVRRVLRDDGTLWLNLGDSYATGGGKVGDCPGGGAQGERWTGNRGANPTNSKRGIGIGPTVQPNRMPLPGLKPKDLVGIPWRVAFALQEAGWYLRSEIIWHKPNPMPESVRDRPTKSHEQIFLFAKSERYYYDGDAIKEPCQSGPSDIRKMTEGKRRIDAKHFHADPGPLVAANHRTNVGNKRAVGGSTRVHGNLPGRDDGGEACNDPNQLYRNRRSVWKIGTSPYKRAHFAVFPPALITPCILAGCPVGGLVLDPFAGSGTTLQVANQHGRNAIGIELNPDYAALIRERMKAA